MTWLTITLWLMGGVDSLWVEREPWKTTTEMRQWLAARVPAQGPTRWRLEHLHGALVSARGLGLREVSTASATAAEVFRQRQADCVGFAYLFAGMARSLGIPVYFVFTERVASWRSGTMRVDEAHLAVAWGPMEQPWVIDFSGIAAERQFRPISDADAAAILASNYGARGLLAGRCSEALRWLELAVRQGPTLASARDNLRVARRLCSP